MNVNNECMTRETNFKIFMCSLRDLNTFISLKLQSFKMRKLLDLLKYQKLIS
jgi:hypothetical protein